MAEFRRQRPGLLRTELNLDAAVPIVGMVAYMYAPKRYLGQTRGLKGHEDLVDAVALLRSRGRGVVGVFVGGPWAGAVRYEASVRSYARRRCGDAAVFLGTRDEVTSLYMDFDVVAHPSHSENVGGAFESLALGVPTVATRVGGFPDVVRPGETGWLVPPCNPEQLAAAIGEALDDRAEASRMARQGQQLVRCMFDVRQTAAEVYRLYGELLRYGGFSHRGNEQTISPTTSRG